MDVSAVIINKLLTEKNVDLWAKLKLAYIDPAFTNLYSAIGKHYEKYASVPSFEELELVLREGPALKTLAVIRLAQADDVPTDVAFDALIDQYTQNETISQLDKFIEKLPVYDSEEIKERLSEIVFYLDEKTLRSENVVSSSDMEFFKEPEEVGLGRVPLGFNNDFDSSIGNLAPGELILLGGRRGSGKSIISANIAINEYEAGFVCPYFSIEMTAWETYQRMMAMLSGVDHSAVKLQKYNDDQLTAVGLTRARMYREYDGAFKDFLNHKNLVRLERQLLRECTPVDNPLIVIDDRNLNLTSIDLHIGKLKAKYGDKFRVAVVDYVNQIVLEGKDMYDWKTQIELSKGLKNIGRKHEVGIVSPYQIDATGEARLAKGLLDAADIGAIISVGNKEDGVINFDTTKIRGSAEVSCASKINWKTLRVSPQPVERAKPADTEEKPKRKKKSETAEVSSEAATDVPPWEM